MRYKELILFCVILTAFSLAIEFFTDFIFADDTPLWKIISVGIIAGIGMYFPFLKYGKGFKYKTIRKKQQRNITLSKTIDSDVLKINLVETIEKEELGLKKKKFTGNILFFNSKLEWKTFGERYRVIVNNKEIIVKSTPKWGFDIVDSGIAFERMNKLEKNIKMLVNQST